MNKKLKSMSIFSIVIMLAAVLFFAGCVEEQNKIIVGTSADFPPFEYTDSNGTIIGFDIDMVTKILQDAGYTVEVQDIAFDSLIPSLESGKIDVIAAAMTITEEREQQIDFSEAYFEADQSIITKVGVDLNLSTNKDLQNFTVGAQTGTTGAGWIEENLVDNGNMSEDDFKRYETYTLAVLDLVNGNIDAIVLDKPVAESYVKNQNVEIVMTIITEEYYGIGVKQGNTELLGKINTGLTTLMNSDDWDALVLKYFG